MSRLLLLGTGACEGIPAPFCECGVCRYAREHGGRDRRRRFGVLIGEETLIDFGPDAVEALRTFGVDETKIRRILVTHSHVDHFAPLDLIWRNGYPERPPLALHSGPEVRRLLEECARKVTPDTALPLELCDNTPGVEQRDNGWRILPVRAAHGENGECAFLYLVTTPEGKRVLIFSDSGNPPEATWQSLSGAEADAAVIEMSFGIHEPYCDEERYHLGARSALKMIGKLRRIGALREKALCVTTHISHCPNSRHAELEEYFRGTGVHAGYDGFSAEL